MKAINRGGGFFLIGGKSNTCYASFLNLAGGRDASIIVIPHASGVPAEAAADVVEALTKLGCSDVRVMTPPSVLKARISSLLWKLGAKRLSRWVTGFSFPTGTTAVYLSGGDQERLVEKLGLAGVDGLRSFNDAGGLIAGTSAGAACMGDSMITGGMKDGAIRADSLRTGNGLGLVPGLVFDTHMVRNRFNRPIVALSLLEADEAIGLDEDTGVLIRNGVAVVIGVGSVWHYRRGEGFSVDFEAGTSQGAVVNVFKAGASFDLHTEI